MTEVNEFIDRLSADATAVSVPAVQAFVNTLSQQVAATAGPKFGQFVGQLVQEVFASQTATIQHFATTLIQSLASRYHPQVSGTLTTRIVDNGVQIDSSDVKLDMKNRATGAVIASLDVPVSVKINLPDFFVKVDQARVTVKDPQFG